ncbi:DEAD/DEAH box helicase [Alicyclobacillus sp. ALC3]|uniref:DEAD/DEAH box helicase n=1 Tax=Alicyclobacillus sp. ALC3 TaxID=2796143 RepID=UPI002377F310|nr:SNF2-related protein [Alicyclobacillus sp. ALC3]
MEHVQGFTPLPHQIETAARVIRDLRGRAILADEVGLGKTIEAGLVMKEYQLRGLARKMLVLTPASLVLQWTRELNEKFRLGAFAQRNEWSWTQYDVLVASLDTAKRDPHRSALLSNEWDLVVVDEAHKLKNSRTRNWQVVNQIPNKYMLLLTATPMQNELRELHTLITLLKPGALGNPQDFVAAHVESRRTPKDPAALKSQLKTIMIRNRRMDGGTNLPPRQVSVVPLDLTSEELALYDGVQTFLREEYTHRKEARISMLPLITLQREICSSPYAAMMTLEKMQKRAKQPGASGAIDQLLRLAEKIQTYTKVDKVIHMLEGIDDKCVVFTEYRATQDFLLYMLKKNGVSAVPFRGGFGRGKKDWMKELFSKHIQVLVATESGGEGINLQFCHNMINFDLPWNPMRLEQRIGRIHRLGQKHNVHVWNLSTNNTIESHIVQLLQEKIRMFELVIGDLDYIVNGEVAGTKFEQGILDAAMTSLSDDDLYQRLSTIGDSVLKTPPLRSDSEVWT